MTEIKICGIKTLREAHAAIEAGASMLGFNFHPKSVRLIDVETCARITSALRQEAPTVQLVGVFVNSSVSEICRILRTCSLDLAQLSGDESPEICAGLGDKGFKAFHGVPAGGVQAYARSKAPAFLVDGSAAGAYGGAGARADWSAAARLATSYPMLLAGGLTPENVAEAVAQVRPWGVDVASGVESRPGEKDAGRINAFVQAVRSVQMESL